MIQAIIDSLGNGWWWVSQIFALIALISFIWGWQIKNKVRMMVLIGIASTALVVSAAFLGNFSLAVLFGLAAIRNFVFAYLDWRIAKGKPTAKWLTYFFAGVFAVSTVTASMLFIFVPTLRQFVAFNGTAWWLELLIMVTLLGLILGNILKGTNLMRVSFMLNRVFNIISHVYFLNLIGVIIASMSIGSNIVYYSRMLVRRIKGTDEKSAADNQDAPVDEVAVESQVTEDIQEQPEPTEPNPQQS